MEPQRDVALIGYGYWGQILYRYLRESERFNLRYVHFRSLRDYDQAAIRRKYGPEFVASIDPIWEDESVTAVLIATPTDTHFALALEALEHGKHVLVEKPLALSGDEAWRLKAAARERGLALMTDYTWTFSRALQYAQRLVGDGEIGDVQGVHIAIRQLGRFTGQDVYTLLGSHALSILDMFVPLQQCAFEAVPMLRTGGLVTGGLIRFGWPGAEGYIDVSLHCPVRERRVILYGERGTLVYDPAAADTLTVTSYRRRGNTRLTERYFRFNEGHNLRYALEAFAEAIQGGGDNAGRSVAVTAVLEGLGYHRG